MKMALTMRNQVLSAFKKLHRTGQMIFQGDPHALTECRTKINSEFRDRINIKDQAELEKAVRMAVEAEEILRTTVVQAEFDEDKHVFKVKVNVDTIRNQNAKMKVGTVPANIRDE